MASGTRERLVESALDLFLRLGFAQVGLDQILQRADLTKTTFYNHFESKEDLIRAAIAMRVEQVAEKFEATLQRRAGDAARERLLAVFDTLEELFSNQPAPRCLLLNATLEFATPQDPTHHLVMKYRDQRTARFYAMAKAAGMPKAEEFTQQFLMLIDGALLYWQVQGHTDSVEATNRTARLLIESHLP